MKSNGSCVLWLIATLSAAAVTGICLLWNDVPGMDAQHSHGAFSTTVVSLVGWISCQETLQVIVPPTRSANAYIFGRRLTSDDVHRNLDSLVPAILEPVKRLVSKARLKWDTAYYQHQQGRLPVTKPWKWDQAKSQTGYDDQKPLTVPAHAWECWGFWLEVFRRPKNGDHRYLTASVLAP
jgi:hypothetical protein